MTGLLGAADGQLSGDRSQKQTFRTVTFAPRAGHLDLRVVFPEVDL